MTKISIERRNGGIYFFTQGIRYTLRHKTRIRDWLHAIAVNESREIESLNYIFCGDAYLNKLNKRFLDHDTLTDILTFDNRPRTGSRSRKVAADVYISVPRVRENARTYKVPLRDELHRVLAHGLLHLAGYHDHSPAARSRMRAQEDYYLSLRSF